MANDISARSPEPAVREEGIMANGEIPILRLIGPLNKKSVHIFLQKFNKKTPQILDFSQVKSVDQYCMQLLVGMSLDHTFLLRGVPFGTQILWERMGMDFGMFTDKITVPAEGV